jgi:hypothetical protein
MDQFCIYPYKVMDGSDIRDTGVVLKVLRDSVNFVEK